MSNFKNYLQLIQESNQHVINEDPITGVLGVVLFYILGTIINPNPGHPLYNKETVTVEQIKKIESEAPKIIKSINNPELTDAFKAELAELAELKELKELKKQEQILSFSNQSASNSYKGPSTPSTSSKR